MEPSSPTSQLRQCWVHCVSELTLGTVEFFTLEPLYGGFPPLLGVLTDSELLSHTSVGTPTFVGGSGAG